MKLFVYKTVKCEIINVEVLSRDLLLNNSAVMVKWKYLKLLYSSKGMCRIDSQSKKMIRLKYLILETPYTFFSVFNWYISFTHTINNTNLTSPFWAFPKLSFFMFVIVWAPSDIPFLQGGVKVTFDYLLRRGESEKLKKGVAVWYRGRSS